MGERLPAAKSALRWTQIAGLVIVALATFVAIAQEVMLMVNNRGVTLADLLLLFIYLEVLSMVAIYLESGKLPIRLPIYIAIVALARYLALDMKQMDAWEIVGVAAATLLLAGAVLVIRFGHIKFPYGREEGN